MNRKPPAPEALLYCRSPSSTSTGSRTRSLDLLRLHPGNWSSSFVWRYGSGLPVHAAQPFRKDRPQGHTTDRLRPPHAGGPGRQFIGSGVRTYVFLQRVLCDSSHHLSPDNWPPGLTSSDDLVDYAAYYTETRRAGGAYLGEDQDGDGLSDWVELSDPRVFGEGRAVRIGLGVSF